MKIKIRIDMSGVVENGPSEGEVFETIKEPNRYKFSASKNWPEHKDAVWIMGKVEPIKILRHEYENLDISKEEEIKKIKEHKQGCITVEGMNNIFNK